jgi:hypothetical protein
MATQVKPRLIQPKRFTGHQKSADVIRNQPAYSIRARDHASQTEAECMAAIYTCKAGTKKMLGKKGRPCMKRDTPATEGNDTIELHSAIRSGDSMMKDIVTVELQQQLGGNFATHKIPIDDF